MGIIVRIQYMLMTLNYHKWMQLTCLIYTHAYIQCAQGILIVNDSS